MVADQLVGYADNLDYLFHYPRTKYSSWRRVMIASAIAYFLTAMFIITGLAGVLEFLRKKDVDYFWGSITLFIIAWICAYFGGI